MIYLTTGEPNSGKSLWLAMLLKDRWKEGATIEANFDLFFSETNDKVGRFHNFEETFTMKGGEKGLALGVDEAYKIFDCRRWASLPLEFSEKLAEHRHDGIDIYTATQNFTDVDKRLRDKVGIWYQCCEILRWPARQNVKPLLQITKVYKRRRRVYSDGRVEWINLRTFWLFIGKWWTKKLYETYENLKMSRFICQIKIENGQAEATIAARELVNAGKVRL